MILVFLWKTLQFQDYELNIAQLPTHDVRQVWKQWLPKLLVSCQPLFWWLSTTINLDDLNRSLFSSQFHQKMTFFGFWVFFFLSSRPKDRNLATTSNMPQWTLATNNRPVKRNAWLVTTCGSPIDVRRVHSAVPAPPPVCGHRLLLLLLLSAYTNFWWCS